MSVTSQCGSLYLNSHANGSQVSLKPSYMQPDPCRFCVFCWTSNHSSHQCEKFNNSKCFWNIVLEDRRCKNCLRLFHQSHKCYNRSFCHLVNCSRLDKHSPVLCHARYWKSNFWNGPANSRRSFDSSEYDSSLRYCGNHLQQSTFHLSSPRKFDRKNFHSLRSCKFKNTITIYITDVKQLYIPRKFEIFCEHDRREGSLRFENFRGM